MTHFKIHLYGATQTSNYSSQMTRTVEVADLECAAKQAQKDLVTMSRIFPELTWRLDGLNQVEAAQK